MSQTIFVTYASQGGSTSGEAQAIGQTLANCGALIDVKPVHEVVEIGSYQAVVIGSADHSGQWLPEAGAFVRRYGETLRRIPTAIFQVCLLLATANEHYRRMVPNWLAPLRQQIRPVAEGSFAEALWPDRYPKISGKLGLSIFLIAVHLQAGDYRNWNAIEAWSKQTYPQLCPQGF